MWLQVTVRYGMLGQVADIWLVTALVCLAPVETLIWQKWGRGSYVFPQIWEIAAKAPCFDVPVAYIDWTLVLLYWEFFSLAYTLAEDFLVILKFSLCKAHLCPLINQLSVVTTIQWISPPPHPHQGSQPLHWGICGAILGWTSANGL